MFGRKRYPGLRGILREMTAENRYSDAGTEPEAEYEIVATDESPVEEPAEEVKEAAEEPAAEAAEEPAATEE